jgi:heme/copper-type cytochrome/quinol oxidase subunit 2
MTDATQPTPSGQDPSGSGGSRSVWTALAIGLGAIVLAGILYLVLRPDDSEPAADTTSSQGQPTTTIQTTTEVTTQETTTTVATTTVQTTTTPEDQPQRVNVRFQNGEVVGGLVEATVERDSQVVITVRADVTDEAHLHGYDLKADVAPGQPGRITFRANTAGVFELELEELGVPIAELTVAE